MLLRVKKLNKSFAVPVLNKLNFELREGEVHALLGSNGAGKSTLCNIISGIHTADSGDFEFSGSNYTPSSLQKAESMGICMVMQELNLFPTLSVAENLFFRSMSDRFGIVKHQVIQKRAKKALETVGLDYIDPAQPLSQLGVGQQQLIEIASVLQRHIKLLILDEPTSALTGPQIDLLFKQILQLKKQGIGVIYITHRMDEISRIADRVSILRDGELVATKTTTDISTDNMLQLMAGEESISIDEKLSMTKPHAQKNKTLLKVENLTRRTKNQSGGDSGFEEINFHLHAGEVLGIGGLIGSGRTELLRTIFGADQAHSGCIRLAADKFKMKRIMRSPTEAISHGMGMLVEDRKSQGLLLSHSVTKNISFAKLNTLINGFGSVNNDIESELAKSMKEKLNIQYNSSNQPISFLSGGNQQKALLARWLAIHFSILLLDEPSRGVDARAKSQIQSLIRELAAQGKALIVVSSETQELLKVSDRIAVMSNGRLAGIFNANDLTEEKLLEASFSFYSSEETRMESIQ